MGTDGWRLVPIMLAAVLCACTGQETRRVSDAEVNAYPANYRTDIPGAVHAYLNDPTGLRDTGISEPTLRPIGGTTRYIVCVRFNAKKDGGQYGGAKEHVAVFLAGRLDQFVPAPRDLCASAAYQPFPELEKLSR